LFSIIYGNFPSKILKPKYLNPKIRLDRKSLEIRAGAAEFTVRWWLRRLLLGLVGKMGTGIRRAWQ
jgi:hypothetical protein